MNRPGSEMDEICEESEPTTDAATEEVASEDVPVEVEASEAATEEAATSEASSEEAALVGAVEQEPAAEDGSAESTPEPALEPPPAPEPSPAAGIDTALPDAELAPLAPRAPWWPFLCYLVAWVGVVAAAILTLSSDASALPAIEQEPYPYLILSGLVLALIGPILSVGVWFFVWIRAEKEHREGLLTSALVKGAGVTLLGVLMWWGTLVAVDALRLGMVG